MIIAVDVIALTAPWWLTIPAAAGATAAAGIVLLCLPCAGRRNP